VSKCRVVTTTSSPATVTRPVVSVSCPVPSTLPATTTAVPTTTAGVTDQLASLAQSLGAGAALGDLSQFAQAGLAPSAPTAVFNNPATQLAPFNPLASLAAFSPPAALAAKSPVLGLFNPAINPGAAFLQFNPAAAPTLALTGGGLWPLGKGFGWGI